jgi:hypothetical protein
MEVKGTIKVINATKVVSEKFSSREFVVETEEQYPQLISMQVTNAKCPVLDGYAVGDKVTASINLRGRKWTNKEGVDRYFNTIECWKISKDGATAPVPSVAPANETANNEEDLPF